jgi:uncharacterized protein
MILVDANILLYAFDTSSDRHRAARSWLEEALEGKEEVRLALMTLLAFIRISTNPAVYSRPHVPEEAISIVMKVLTHPNVRVAEPTDRHWSVLARLSRSGQARGPLLMDAHLAALAMEHGAMLCTTDRGFARFPRLRYRDPLAA